MTKNQVIDVPSAPEFSRKSLWRVPFKYGLIGAGLNTILFLLLYFLDKNPLTVSGPFDFSFLIIPLMLVFSLKEFKDHHNQGELRFWQGLTLSLVCYFTLAFSFAFILFFLLKYLDASILEGFVQDRMELLQSRKTEMVEQFGADVYEEQILKTGSTSPYIKALDDFWKKLIIGLLLAVPIAVILRK